METLLIGDRAEGIIRIDTLVADAELGELVILSVLLDSLLCGTCVSGRILLIGVGPCLTKRLPAPDGGKVKVGITAVDRSKNAALEIHGPSFVQPASHVLALGDE